MHADISRDTFDPKRNTLRVVQEQGALLLDADANEQTAILLHRLLTLAADLFGPFWGPAGTAPDGKTPLAGFQIGKWDSSTKDFPISGGRYYANGLLCSLDAPTTCLKQPAFCGTTFPVNFDPSKAFVVYLDVWEREITVTELRSAPGRIDPAFQALSPAPRTELVWQVKVFQDTTKTAADLKNQLYASAAKVPVDPLTAATNLAALLSPSPPPVPPPPPALYAQVASPPSGGSDGDYNGPENQLYRVEIHRGGQPYQAGSGSLPAAPATFKWSRDNGSVTFPLDLSTVDMSTGKPTWQPDSNQQFLVTLTDAGRDDRTSLQVHDRVEYIDAAIAIAPEDFAGQPIRQLFEVIAVNSTSVTLKAPQPGTIVLPVVPAGLARWAFLRRWDFQQFGNDPPLTQATGAPPQSDDGALLVVAPSTSDSDTKMQEWLDLEDEIQIRFAVGGDYRPGDFWLIPARTATGDIIWPLTDGPLKDTSGKTIPTPKSVPATSRRHHYAPLAIIDATGAVTDCRRQAALASLTQLVVTPT